MLRRAEGRKVGLLWTQITLQIIVYFVFQITKELHIQYLSHLLQRNFWSLCAKMFPFKLSVWPATRHCVPTWSSLPISGLYWSGAVKEYGWAFASEKIQQIHFLFHVSLLLKWEYTVAWKLAKFNIVREVRVVENVDILIFCKCKAS